MENMRCTVYLLGVVYIETDNLSAAVCGGKEIVNAT